MSATTYCRDMTVAERRQGKSCVSPMVIDHVVDDPEAVRELARRSGPYRFPERPGGFVWPTWHTQWASDGTLHLEAARHLFEHQPFLDAAAEMAGTERVRPRGLYVNLGTPFIAQPVSHTDQPEFRGVDASIAPGWFLQSMGASRLFEAERCEVFTAVAWFFAGEHGGFSYWPDGRSAPKVHHTATWNTAVLGDNNFMHHKVESIGPDGRRPSPAMTNDATLDFRDGEWVVEQHSEVLDRHSDEEVRLSLSWTASIDEDATATISLDDVHQRMAAAIGPDFAAPTVGDLFTEPARLQLHALWPGYLPD